MKIERIGAVQTTGTGLLRVVDMLFLPARVTDTARAATRSRPLGRTQRLPEMAD